jgi:hypothetical protein
MKIRFLQVHDGLGSPCKPILQFWDKDSKTWKPVKTVHCFELDIDKANSEFHFFKSKYGVQSG